MRKYLCVWIQSFRIQKKLSFLKASKWPLQHGLWMSSWKQFLIALSLSNSFRVHRDAPAKEDLIELAVEVISELESQICRFRYENPMNIRNLLNYLDGEIVTYTLTKEEMVANLKEPAVKISCLEEEDDSEELPKICLDDAIFMLKKLQHFWLQQERVHTENLLLVRSMMDAARSIQTEKLQQTTLDRFFVKKQTTGDRCLLSYLLKKQSGLSRFYSLLENGGYSLSCICPRSGPKDFHSVLEVIRYWSIW